MRLQRQKLPFRCNQRRRTLPVRITWRGDWTSGVSLRCESASRGQKFQLKKFFNFFFKTCLFHVSGRWDNSKRKKIFRLSDHSESGYRNEIPKAETPITFHQRRRTLPVRITWKGVSLHCDARVPDASRVQTFSMSKKFLYISVSQPRSNLVGH